MTTEAEAGVGLVGDAAGVAEGSPLLVVEGLTVGYPGRGGVAVAVNDVSFGLTAGERVGIVGESGSGKSTLALALMRLLPQNATVRSGRITLGGVDLMALTPGELRAVRGVEAGMVFQNPMTSFDPLRTLGDHLVEGLRAHGLRSRPRIRERMLGALREAELPQPEVQARRHPHELSGGMRQRGLIALAIQHHPRLLIADEPTTALDVTIQAQILDLFGRISEVESSHGMALLLVSHNLGVVRQLSTRVIVMYAGRIVEDAPTEQIFADPRHPYTRALLGVTPRASAPRGRLRTIPGQPVDVASLPVGCAYGPRCTLRPERAEQEVPQLVELPGGRRVACFVGELGPLPPEPADPAEPSGSAAAAGAAAGVGSAAGAAAGSGVAPSAMPAPSAAAPMVRIRDLVVEFGVRRPGGIRPVRDRLRAVAGVDLEIASGETLAIVGESGSGKTTLARAVLGLVRPASGSVRVDGDDPADTGSPVRRGQRIQAVFQDPHGSLDPRLTVGASIEEPMQNMGIAGAQRRERVAELLDEVRLTPAYAARYPRELSGGQAQRVAIARAMAVRPRLIVLDEPTASLDVSIAGHIVNLLLDLQERHGLTYLFVSHDLVTVRQLATRIAVMYLGRVVELARWVELFERPLHPYASALLSGIPKVDAPAGGGGGRIILSGEVPSPVHPPPGCVFHPRCPAARDRCTSEVPALRDLDGRQVSCHFPGALGLDGSVMDPVVAPEG